MKKIFLIITSCIATLSVWAYDFMVDNIYYSVLDSNALAVAKSPSGDNQYQGDIVIPSIVEYNGKNYIVREISESAFSQNFKVKSVVLPDSLLYIRRSAFFNTPIDGHLIIPDKVVVIEDDAFDSCQKLDSITIGKGVTKIGMGCFSMMFPTLTTVIWNATNVKEVRYGLLPSSVTTVIFGDDVEHILANICPMNMTRVVLGKRTKSIAAYAFENCSSLQEITIPDSVISIGENAFNVTSSLSKIVWNAIAYPDIEDSFYHAFFDDYGGKIKSFIFGENVRHIPGEICYKLSGVKSITIPQSVETIGAYAFYRSGITNLIIPNNVVSIGENAFTSCPLQSVEIGKGVKYLGEDAFGGCFTLTQTSYSGNIADWCDINFANIGANPAGYSTNLYINGEKLTDIVVPSSVDSIKDCVFANNYSLQKVVLGENVKHIGFYAFGDCTNLDSIDMGNQVTTIDRSAFWNCKNLTTIRLPKQIEYIGETAFWLCKKLVSVTCEADSVPQLGIDVFKDVPTATATLYVPEGSIDLYKTAEQWEEFGQILPIQLSEVEDLATSENSRRKFIHNGQIFILRDGKTYNIMGMEIK